MKKDKGKCTICGQGDPQYRNGRCQDVPGSVHDWRPVDVAVKNTASGVGVGSRFIYRAKGPYGLACGRATTHAWTTREEAEAWCTSRHAEPGPYVVDVLGGVACPECGSSVLVAFKKMPTPSAYEATIERHNVKPGGALCKAFVQVVWEEAP